MVLDSALNYIEGNSIVSLAIFATLSLYFIIVIWVFIYRYFYLSRWISREKYSLKILFRTGSLGDDSILLKCLRKDQKVSSKILEACKDSSIKEATSGLTILAIIASTSPFIGLFGTVVGILEAFSAFENETRLSLNVIAPAISEALVATAVGIFVAIPAYSFHLTLKRKAFELATYLQNQIKIIDSQEDK